MSEIVRHNNECSDIEISQKTNIHSVYTKNILPLFRKLQDLLDKLFVLNVKIFIVHRVFIFQSLCSRRNVIFNIHKT